MQKIVFYVGSLGLFSLLVTACVKEEIVPNCTKQEATVSKNAQEMDKIGPKKPRLKIWYDNGSPDGTRDIDYGCRDTGGNCLERVTVTAQLKADIRGIGQVILHGSASQIINEFKTKRNLLEPIVGTSHVQGVINSALIPEVRGVDDDVIYLVFYNQQKTKVLMVYPVE